MTRFRNSWVVNLALVSLSSCFLQGGALLDHRESYIICLNKGQNSESVKSLLGNFANHQRMEIYDRSVQAEEELVSLPDAAFVLSNTIRPVILMTAEKVGDLRISITNISLNNSLSLTFSYNGEVKPREIGEFFILLKSKFQVFSSVRGKVSCGS